MNLQFGNLELYEKIVEIIFSTISLGEHEFFEFCQNNPNG
jgi:hypothetical protein